VKNNTQRIDKRVLTEEEKRIRAMIKEADLKLLRTKVDNINVQRRGK
jgi:hypothetical protein